MSLHVECASITLASPKNIDQVKNVTHPDDTLAHPSSSIRAPKVFPGAVRQLPSRESRLMVKVWSFTQQSRIAGSIAVPVPLPLFGFGKER